MLNFFQKALMPCLACKSSLSENSTPPFCPPCLASLRKAPLGLCTVCFSVCKPDAHPFLKAGDLERIDSLHIEYWLIGQSFEVAKAWKKKTGYLSNRALFQWNPENLKSLHALNLTHIVPMPQRVARIRQLHGKSPALEVANSLARALSLPVVPLLQMTLENELRGKRQSLLNQEGRTLVKERFEISGDSHGFSKMRILLVDDFTTTGHTLRQAVRVLRLSGIQKVHCFCLGVRPRFSRTR